MNLTNLVIYELMTNTQSFASLTDTKQKPRLNNNVPPEQSSSDCDDERSE